MGLNTEARNAIRELFEQYQHDIYRFALYSLQNESLAYDVVQETFLRAIASWSRFRHEATPKTWLLTIARNYMYDTHRKQQKREKFVQEYGPLGSGTYREQGLESTIEESMVLEQAIASLKESYRQVFILRHVEELSVAETAKVLGWTEGKVRMTDFRAIGQLREMLSSDAGEVTQ